jgi:hypothetical protein
MTQHSDAPGRRLGGNGMVVGVAIGLICGLLLSGDLALMVVVGAAVGLIAGAAWELHRSP